MPGGEMAVVPPRASDESIPHYFLRLDATSLFAFHGSPTPGIQVLEPRAATDLAGGPWGNDTAVYAVPPVIAVGRAILPPRDTLRGSWRVESTRDPRAPVTMLWGAITPGDGWVYVVARRGLLKHARFEEWKSRFAVPVLAAVQVNPGSYLELGGRIVRGRVETDAARHDGSSTTANTGTGALASQERARYAQDAGHERSVFLLERAMTHDEKPTAGISSEGKASERKPRGSNTIALTLPEGVNLAEMSDAEVEKLALELSRKAAAGLGRGATIQGINAVSLLQQKSIGVGIGWERACDFPDLNREGVVINPADFRSPIDREAIGIGSARYTINREAVAAQTDAVAARVETVAARPKASVKKG